MASLEEEKVKKSELNEPEEIVLYYDFKPYEHNDPLLLVDPKKVKRYIYIYHIKKCVYNMMFKIINVD